MDIGIDLGTTFSVLAVEGRVELAPDYPGGPGIHLEDCDVTVIPSPFGETTFPSVAIQDPADPDRWLFGSEALQMAEEGHAPVMFSKRKIGTLEGIPVATGTVMAREVAARFLGHLKQCAELALGQQVRRAVVTHPAYFDRGAVEETRQAAAEAGFDMSLPQQLLMEPTAAALAYTRSDRRDPLRILTYDLGGGTFDVTYMERIDGLIQIRGFDGNHLLGGYNFDKELLRMVRQRLEAKGRRVAFDESDPRDRGRLARLLRIAEQVKIRLAAAKADTDPMEFSARGILVDEVGAHVHVSERITREQFVSAIRPWLDDVIACCRRALEKGKARPQDLHQILLVGGSSHGPWIRESLLEAFPGAEVRLFHPELCVGAGAAIQARMALPRGEEVGDFLIERNAPEVSVWERVHVAGRIVRKGDGGPAGDGLSVLLKPASGPEPPRVEPDARGGFLFRDVELAKEGANRFVLCVRSADGAVLAEQPFVIDYVPVEGGGGADGSRAVNTMPSTTVLPRPLYVETRQGLVALAEEGVALPAKVIAHFERSNSNPSMSLKLFQEQDPVGVVRIENIPAEAGEGSPVVLTIEVTADNQVRGDVVIHRLVPAANGGEPGRVEALRSPVQVSFDPLEIPGAEQLRRQFGDLRARVEMLPLIDPWLAGEIGADCAALMERVERGFEHQPFERQEVYADVRRLGNLLMPPKDEMSPTRKEYVMLAGSTRKDIAELRSTHRAMQDEMARDGREEIVIDGRKVTARRVTAVLGRLDQLEAQLRALEQAGLSFHTRKDRLGWPKSHERLIGLAREVDALKPPAPDITALPTRLLKLFVLEREVQRRLGRLSQHARLLQDRGEFRDWIGTLAEIRQRLEQAGEQIWEIDDDMPSKQSLARIQVILQTVRALDARLDALGTDV